MPKRNFNSKAYCQIFVHLLAASYNPVAVYPLSAATKGRDMSARKNPRAILGSVRPAPGPDGKKRSSYQFFGRPNSYIHLPNNGALDTVNSITVSLWVYPQGPGPLVNYNPKGQGMQIWMVSPTQLFVRFVRRRGRRLTSPLIYRIYRRSWNYVTAVYNRRTGVARLYVNNRLVRRKLIGKIRLATNYPVRLGAKIKGRRSFKGRLACLQIYNTALTGRQIALRKKMCYRTRGRIGYEISCAFRGDSECCFFLPFYFGVGTVQILFKPLPFQGS